MFFSAKSGLELIRKTIEKQLKIPVESFKIIYNRLNNKLTFHIDGKEYPYDSKQLMGLIEFQLDGKLPKNCEVDLVTIEHSIMNEPSYTVFYRNENGEKIKEHINI